MGVGYNPKIVTESLVFCIDAANPRSFSPNVFPGSLDIYEWWSSVGGSGTNACTVSKDPTISLSPVGGVPLKMNVTGNDPHIVSYSGSQFNIMPASNGQTWTISTYVKGSVNTTGELFIFGANATGFLTGTSGTTFSAGTVNITTEWTRVEFTFTFNSANVAYLQMRLDGPQTGGSGQNIWWDGLQLQPSSSATAFNSTVNTNYSSWLNLANSSITSTINSLPSFDTTRSLSFDNSSEYIVAPLNLSFTQGTVSAWVYPTVANNNSIFVYTANNPLSSWTHQIGVGSDNKWRTYIFDGVGKAANSVSSVVLNNWYHVALVWLNSSYAKCYVNGVEESSISIGTAWQSGNNFWIGCRTGEGSGSPYNAFVGKISSVHVYNRALSEAELRQNFNALRGRFGV